MTVSGDLLRYFSQELTSGHLSKVDLATLPDWVIDGLPPENENDEHFIAVVTMLFIASKEEPETKISIKELETAVDSFLMHLWREKLKRSGISLDINANTTNPFDAKTAELIRATLKEYYLKPLKLISVIKDEK